MSAERIVNIEKKDPMTFNTPKAKEKIFSGRVDINDLMARARKEKEKVNKTNLIFFALFALLILILGILLSL